ncbi:hypothetical protein QQY24_01595 [Streptomyces sp. TG1A-8]|uniref:hypothetical protein n=1 Tax=Streptomyces sp. TG1A-8 TaxID=3051385 RepID=UPI00265C7FB3|nr:hypothetical protein [Streptomyces sp. TG1A-8]MDO0924173.1 hypothetical protein [Streptomyces sp. TG1A-8]
MGHRTGRTHSAFALTAGAYAPTAAQHSRSWPGRGILWLHLFTHLYRTGSTTAGALLGSLVRVIPAGTASAH